MDKNRHVKQYISVGTYTPNTLKVLGERCDVRFTYMFALGRECGDLSSVLSFLHDLTQWRQEDAIDEDEYHKEDDFSQIQLNVILDI